MVLSKFDLNGTISIHALTRRATNESVQKTGAQSDFNPRPHEEGDVPMEFYITKGSDFNPRPHEEGDKTRLAALKTAS